LGLVAWIGATAFLCCSAQAGQEAQAPGIDKPAQSDGLGSQAAEVRGLEQEAERPVANLTEREKRIAADKARLLKLATELKQEMDRSGTDTLSLGVIRKAAEIEKLAHSVKQEMNRNLKQTH
jgi:hypothetical protein